MKQLKTKLQKIDGKGYKAYKDIQGVYKGNNFSLHIDHVQSDPFAAPSRIRVVIPLQEVTYDNSWFETYERKTAVEDFFARKVAHQLRTLQNHKKGSGKSGLIHIDTPGQEVIERTAVNISREAIDIRLSVGLPAAGRKILARQAEQLLCDQLPTQVTTAVFTYNQVKLQQQLSLTDQQQAIRAYLNDHHYVCFVANGSILPRESGVSNRPLDSKTVVPFQSPKGYEIEIPVPHGDAIRGMAIPEGVSLIVGGGYHGKSTLLQAIERGIYNHIRGDGREFVITNETAYKVRSEDGRRIEKVNLSPFISNLPFNKDTKRFSSDDASGSTSQAANIIECLEMGSKALLIDEDTSATNFMIRDARMQQLVATDKEPITPFIDRVRQLYDTRSVSSILVIGGSGEYFDVADHIIMMDEYQPVDVTARAKDISKSFTEKRESEPLGAFGEHSERIIQRQSLQASAGKKEKFDSKGLTKIVYGRTDIDLSFVEQLISPSQTRAIAFIIRYLSKGKNKHESLPKMLDDLYTQLEKDGLDMISPFAGKHPGDLVLPRKVEVAAAINRLRTLQVQD
ncbi:ABC-ATPase domain-containing protein [Desertibacillus haloalkaliphilus]|uniref:ABC-ATPase domain-containing protein n=1 Tax=Desertibacillus haloalkaliphilus TaxID=1328930 RepID=UPI001C25ADE3|nr:ABC-ATPase domain-containing protein [Desertibacillus haloalkaliphilus]MBU8906854.1 ABC-ATPase domain-containing protein [Desertibacillus haloalkaliphilus]